MTRKEQHDKEPSPPQAHKDPNDPVAVGFEENKEYWLEHVNEHLENLLKKENRDVTMHRNMARHYYARNMVSRVKVKNMNRKLKKALKKLKKRDNLNLLADASLVA